MDMSGAAAVLEAVSAIAKLELPINILAVIPSTENMPSGTAVKPGDIITQLNGKTVEVNNTDAEGRLILADALAYSVELGADRIVDLATLTGAVIVALGSTYAGLISNDDAFAERGRGSGEPHGRARLAPSASPRVQGAHQGHRGGSDQRLVQAQGLDDLRRLLPRGVRRRQALGPPGHRRNRLGRRPRVHRQGAERLRDETPDRPGALARELDREQPQQAAAEHPVALDPDPAAGDPAERRAASRPARDPGRRGGAPAGSAPSRSGRCRGGGR